MSSRPLGRPVTWLPRRTRGCEHPSRLAFYVADELVAVCAMCGERLPSVDAQTVTFGDGEGG